MRHWSPFTNALLVGATVLLGLVVPSVDCFCASLRSLLVHHPDHVGSSRSVVGNRRRQQRRCGCILLLLQQQQQEHNNNSPSPTNATPIRLNKVFKATHSRRQADALIASGRVKVNGHPVTTKGGIWVTPFVDNISLDDKLVQGWEALNGLKVAENKHTDKSNHGQDDDDDDEDATTAVFEYIKYWKPRGVTCTTDTRIRGNIIDEIINISGYRPSHRVFPVGRLDKDTSGLILLTSDGRLPNSFLRRKRKQPKVYNVMVDKPLQQQDLERLRVRECIILVVVSSDRCFNDNVSLTHFVSRSALNRMAWSLQLSHNETVRQNP